MVHRDWAPASSPGAGSGGARAQPSGHRRCGRPMTSLRLSTQGRPLWPWRSAEVRGLAAGEAHDVTIRRAVRQVVATLGFGGIRRPSSALGSVSATPRGQTSSAAGRRRAARRGWWSGRLATPTAAGSPLHHPLPWSRRHSTPRRQPQGLVQRVSPPSVPISVARRPGSSSRITCSSGSRSSSSASRRLSRG